MNANYQGPKPPPPRVGHLPINALSNRQSVPARLLAASLLFALLSCGDTSSEPRPESAEQDIGNMRLASPSSLTPERVAEALALGSDSTDLQRELIEKELVGSVVEWEIQIYEISLSHGFYKLTSQAIPIKNPDAVQLTRVVALISPGTDSDHQFLKLAKTGDHVRIRGLVREILLRTVITVQPAILMLGTAEQQNIAQS